MPVIKPVEILQLNGAFKHDPQRRRDPGPKSPNPLGNPPTYFDPDERKCWREIERIIPESVLCESDRIVVELASRYLTKFRRREPMTAADIGKLINCLSLIGATPVDRQRLAAPKTEKKNDFDDFA